MTAGLVTALLLTSGVQIAGSAISGAAPARTLSGGAHNIPGDIDGDGKSDLVVSSLFSVRIFYTSAAPGGDHQQVITPPDNPGVSQIATGDFNGDGYADLAVGADTANPDGPAGAYDGAFFVYYGSATGLDTSGYTEIDGATGAGDEFGDELIAIDLDQDGKTDLLEHTSFTAGKFKVFYGSSGGVTTAGSKGFKVGDTAGAEIGDVNGDGKPDLVVGRPDQGKVKYQDHHEVFVGSEGFVSVFYGKAGGTFANKAVSIHGLKVGTKYGLLGSSIAVAHVNGDKYADVIAGAPNTKIGGDVVVLYGGKHGLSASHHSIVDLNTAGVVGKMHGADNLGETVAAGDFNDDGYADVVAGAPQENNGRKGYVVVIRGAKHGITTSHSQLFNLKSFTGHQLTSSESAWYGSALAVLRPSHTKYASLAIGANFYSTSVHYSEGMFDLYIGSKHGLTSTGGIRATGAATNESLGMDLAA
jgi:hypothetical protein